MRLRLEPCGYAVLHVKLRAHSSSGSVYQADGTEHFGARQRARSRDMSVYKIVGSMHSSVVYIPGTQDCIRNKPSALSHSDVHLMTHDVQLPAMMCNYTFYTYKINALLFPPLLSLSPFFLLPPSFLLPLFLFSLFLFFFFSFSFLFLFFFSLSSFLFLFFFFLSSFSLSFPFFSIFPFLRASQPKKVTDSAPGVDSIVGILWK